MKGENEKQAAIFEADFDLDRIMQKHRWWMFVSMVAGVVVFSTIAFVVAKLT